MTSTQSLNYDEFFAAAKTRLKAVREATFTEVVARLRTNYDCRHSWLKMSSEASFERIYLFYFFRTYGTDGDIFIELKPTLESAGRALNHHLRAVASTWQSMDADDLAMSVRKFMKIQFGEIFNDLISLADNIKSDDTVPLRNADSCPFRAGEPSAASECEALNSGEIWSNVLSVPGPECGE
jgi:hypothetical protein